jgi:Fe-S-cluster containining protein
MKGSVSVIRLKKDEKFTVKRSNALKRFFLRIKRIFTDDGLIPDKGKEAHTSGKSVPVMKPARKLNEATIQKREFCHVTHDTRWRCRMCGWCCRQNWRVNVTWKEYDRLNGTLNIEQVVEDKATGMSHPLFEIKDACVCLDVKTNKCKIHSKWPYACATFPFALSPEGDLLYSKWCKGIGEGPIVNKEKMRKKIMRERKRAGMQG